MTCWFFALLLTALCACAHAEVISVEQIEKGFFISATPTLTMYWQGQDSKAVLLFIPGGEGHIGLKPGQTDMRFHFFQMLKRLTNPALTSGKFDVVLLDSPTALSPNQCYPITRGGPDHLLRIESVLRFYKAKTGLPVWLMGHSNGGISLTEFVKHAQKEDKMGLIAGIISSAARTETNFKPSIDLPFLVLHHQQDGCSNTLANAAAENFNQVKAFNKGFTELAWLLTGQPEPKDPCRSGLHMYYGASEEAAKVIDGFMLKSYP